MKVASAAVAALFQTVVVFSTLNRIAAKLPNDSTVLSQEIPGVLSSSFLLTLVCLSPIMVALGVLTTFPIVGPLYRFRMFLTSVKNGEQPGTCRIRKGDQLQDFCELINDVTAPLREGAGASEEMPSERAA
mgnify:CR=1 FL=1